MPKTRILLIVAAAVLVAGAALAQTPPGHAVLREAGLAQASPSYAALSFAQPQSLPTRLGSPHTSVRVPFTIQNHSSATQSYQWSLSAAGTGPRGGPAARRVTGRTTLPPGAAATMNPALRLSCTGGQVRFTVRLASPAESVYFLADCPAATK
jgi:hypothetical protein